VPLEILHCAAPCRNVPVTFTLERMKAPLARLKALFADPLFARVCMVIWGAPFLAAAVVAAFRMRPTEGVEWLLVVFFGLLGMYGAFLVSVAFLGSDSRVERSTSFMAEGGELLGVVFALAVAVVAVPVTLILKAARRRIGE